MVHLTVAIGGRNVLARTDDLNREEFEAVHHAAALAGSISGRKGQGFALALLAFALMLLLSLVVGLGVSKGNIALLDSVVRYGALAALVLSLVIGLFVAFRDLLQLPRETAELRDLVTRFPRCRDLITECAAADAFLERQLGRSQTRPATI